MSLKKYSTIAGIVFLMALTAGCVANTDPLVGVWKQEAPGLAITMDLRDGGKGTMSIDSSALFQNTTESPEIEMHALTWKQINDTCVQIREANDTSSYAGLFNYNEADRHIWDTTGSTRLDFHKQ